MSIRDEIRELCIAHDRFMAEQASEPTRRPPVSETDDPGLVYKEYDNSEPASAPRLDAEPSDGDWRDTVAEAMGIVIAETRKEMRAERAAEIAPLKTEIAELRGQVSALLTMLGAGDKAKDASIIALPNWRKRTDAA